MKLLGLSDFEGAWRLRREIFDRSSGSRIEFVGEARFQASGIETLSYLEEGLLTMPGQQPIVATRQYVWKKSDQQITVCYADGSYFHSFTPAGYSEGTQHVCGNDVYGVVYDFCEWPKWVFTWEVVGPRKDYRSVTVCEPIE